MGEERRTKVDRKWGEGDWPGAEPEPERPAGAGAGAGAGPGRAGARAGAGERSRSRHPPRRGWARHDPPEPTAAELVAAAAELLNHGSSDEAFTARRCFALNLDPSLRAAEYGLEQCQRALGARTGAPPRRWPRPRGGGAAQRRGGAGAL